MSSDEKKLFLLDAYALIYRAHFAFSRNPRISSKGVNTGVPFGFTNTLLEVLQKQKPSHIGIAFDTSAPTFRHKEYKEYKATRQETPEDIKTGIPMVKDIIRAFNIPIIELDGYEADDIVGTLAKKAEKKGFTVYMMTPDKDFSQLVTENILLYKPSYMGSSVDILGTDEVLEKWNIENVNQVIDIIGLQGDSSDNIPGIPGIGPKTASKLIKEYGSVEGLVANVANLKGKQKENVETYGDQGILSKQLATIKTDTPVEFNEKDLKYDGWDESKLKEIFEDLEFRTILKRLFGETATGSSGIPEGDGGQMTLFSASSETTEEATIPDSEPVDKDQLVNHTYHYRILTSEKEYKELLDYLKAQNQVSFKTFSDHDNPFDSQLRYVGFSYHEGDAYLIPLPEDQKKTSSLLHLFDPVFTSQKCVLAGHDLKRDIVVLKKYDIEVSASLLDIMLVHYLLEPDLPHGLDVLAETELNYSMLTIPNLLAEQNIKRGSFEDLSNNNKKLFCCEQVDITNRMANLLTDKIRGEDLNKLYYQVEMPLLKVLAKMEFEGVKIDRSALKEMSEQLDSKSREIQKEIFDIAGEEFNINSPKQLGYVLFEKLKLIEKPKKTKSGQYATGEEILSKLEREHEIASKILTYREYQKLKSTYVDALPLLISDYDDRIHSTFSQAVAATGRLSSNNPNLQNIPIRTEIGRTIRKAFVPNSNDFKLLSADYSQIELRIMASFSKDKHMMDAFKENKDIHATTASKIFSVPLREVTDEMRRMAKTANFGMIYGISAFGLSQNLNIPRKEAAEIIDSYFKEFHSVKKYMDQVINEAKEKGYVKTLLGRKRYLRDINSRNATMRGYSERNAINAPIQGSAADMIKIAMINIDKWMNEENLKSKMILQVHDELVFEGHKDEVDLLTSKIPELMKEALPLEVPIEVEIGTGNNWLEAH